MVSVKDGSIETELYTKPTDKHQDLLVSSCHPQHTKRSIPFGLALRLRRICSNPDNYKLRTNELIDYLANRGYDKTFLKTQIQRASDILRTDALTKNPRLRLKPPLSSLLIIQHYPTLRISFNSILTCCTHQIAVEMLLKTFR